MKRYLVVREDGNTTGERYTLAVAKREAKAISANGGEDCFIEDAKTGKTVAFFEDGKERSVLYSA